MTRGILLVFNFDLKFSSTLVIARESERTSVAIHLQAVYRFMDCFVSLESDECVDNPKCLLPCYFRSFSIIRVIDKVLVEEEQFILLILELLEE